MMSLLPVTAWNVFCPLFLLLLKEISGQSHDMQCSLSPSGALHPVQALQETFQAGPGCAARETGDKETHVVAVKSATHSPDSQVTVVLKPLAGSSHVRHLILVLSSQLPLHWWLEAEKLPPNLPVLVQVSSNSTVQSYTLPLRVQLLRSLPLRPGTLLRWAQRHYGSLSSLTHTTRANRVYIRLGEDASLPAVCQLQSVFLSRNYLTSDLQSQEVQGCTPTTVGGDAPEVHVIKLLSAGSGLCGSLQVEVTISLVPPVARSGIHRVVLILSSSVPVNWALSAHGLRGHITVHASNSVSLPFPHESYLTVTSVLNVDLSTTPDLLAWANDSGFLKVTSYTEADLANRFVIQMAGGGTEVVPTGRPVMLRPPWGEESMRKWLNGRGRTGGPEAFAVQCDDGRLSVAVDKHILQSLALPVAAVTLQDPHCQAQSNGSHFLLVFPVISCGTEAVFLGNPRGVQYKNMVLIWRVDPQRIIPHNETKKTDPFGMHISCLALLPSPPPLGPVEGFLPTPRQSQGPILALKLFVTESYEHRTTGPCVVIADHRVYVEVSAKGPVRGGVEVSSCMLSPLSDPRRAPYWTIFRSGCATDPSLTLSNTSRYEEAKEEEEEGGGGNLEDARNRKGGREEETHPAEGISFRRRDGDRRRNPAVMADGMMSLGGAESRTRAEMEGTHSLRFSFILRPIYNDPMQFVHCSLRLCVSGSTAEGAKTTAQSHCHGRPTIPPLVPSGPSQQCEIRNLSRPMVVTQPISSLAAKPLAPPAGQRTIRPSVSQLLKPTPENSSSLVETGPVLGIVFAAFVMGISLTGALWCIYTYTGSHPLSSRRGSILAASEQSTGSHGNWNPPALMDLSSSSV